MKPAFFVWCFLFLAAPTFGQSSDISPINQPTGSASPNAQSPPDPKTHGKLNERYGKLPLSFEANRGQTDGQVKFLSRGHGYTLFLTSHETVFSFRGSKTTDSRTIGPQLRPSSDERTADAVLRMKLVKANPTAKVVGADELSGKSNYFIGNDPKKWRSNVPTYARVNYEGIYPGIDLVYYGTQGQLEYDFVVAPGADPHRIQFDVRGAKSISREKDGDLVLHMAEGEVRWHKPLFYQEKDGRRQEIDGRYVIEHGRRVGFEASSYDPKRPLTIDPALGYSTYLGGGRDDVGFGIAVDSSGNAYLTGYTTSTNFPTMGPLQPGNGGKEDAFVTKINASGSALVYST
jgi:Beta-propeller repeat